MTTEFDQLCDLDTDLQQLRDAITEANVPTRMPHYYRTWQAIEKHLAAIVHASQQPQIRNISALRILFEGIRDLYQQRAEELA